MITLREVACCLSLAVGLFSHLSHREPQPLRVRKHVAERKIAERLFCAPWRWESGRHR